MDYFKVMTDEELRSIYEEDLIFKKKGVCATPALREILDKYCDKYQSFGIVTMETELLREIAFRWMKKQGGDPVKGDSIWYVDEDGIEVGTVDGVGYKEDGTIDSIAVDFKDDYEVFYGSAYNSCLFTTEAAARERYKTVNKM